MEVKKMENKIKYIIREVLADWEIWDKNNGYDVISVYIKENGVIKFNYQDDGTIAEQ